MYYLSFIIWVFNGDCIIALFLLFPSQMLFIFFRICPYLWTFAFRELPYSLAVIISASN